MSRLYTVNGNNDISGYAQSDKSGESYYITYIFTTASNSSITDEHNFQLFNVVSEKHLTLDNDNVRILEITSINKKIELIDLFYCKNLMCVIFPDSYTGNIYVASENYDKFNIVAKNANIEKLELGF